jgi:hypothetical protein
LRPARGTFQITQAKSTPVVRGRLRGPRLQRSSATTLLPSRGSPMGSPR